MSKLKMWPEAMTRSQESRRLEAWRRMSCAMRGSYIMKDELGKDFKIKIPLFFLRDHRHNQ